MTRTNGWLGAAFEMTKRCVWLAATLIPACSSGNPGQFIRPMAPVVALAHVRIIDGTGGPGKDDQTVVIKRGRIFALGDRTAVHVPAGAQTLDLHGRTLIPGLVGLHEHLFYQLESGGTTSDVLAQRTFARLYLASGVTTIRTAGTLDLDGDARLKRQIDAGQEPGPKIHLTGRYLQATTAAPDPDGITRGSCCAASHHDADSRRRRVQSRVLSRPARCGSTVAYGVTISYSSGDKGDYKMMLAARTILGTLSLAVTVAAAGFTGTWKLDLAKSKPRNDLASETMKIEQTGPNAYRTTVDNVLKSGQKAHQEINRIYDGKEHPATGTGFKQEGATEICEQLDASTRKVTQKRDGKVTSEFTSTVSSDGKVMTNVRKGGGDETLVFERQ
jgi:hypothetical protein